MEDPGHEGWSNGSAGSRRQAHYGEQQFSALIEHRKEFPHISRCNCFANAALREKLSSSSSSRGRKPAPQQKKCALSFKGVPAARRSTAGDYSARNDLAKDWRKGANYSSTASSWFNGVSLTRGTRGSFCVWSATSLVKLYDQKELREIKYGRPKISTRRVGTD